MYIQNICIRIRTNNVYMETKLNGKFTHKCSPLANRFRQPVTWLLPVELPVICITIR